MDNLQKLVTKYLPGHAAKRSVVFSVPNSQWIARKTAAQQRACRRMQSAPPTIK
jgi:hypothetical protein